MVKRKSMFLKLVVPICVVTILFWAIATTAMSAVYTKQAEDGAVHSSTEILKQTANSIALIHQHVAKVAQQISGTHYLHSILSQDSKNVREEWDKRRNISALFVAIPNAMLDYSVTIVGKNGLAISSGVGGVTKTAEELMAMPVFEASKQSGYITYASQKEVISYGKKPQDIILGCKALIDSEGSYGAVFITIAEKSLREFYENFTNRGMDIVLLSEDGTIFSAQGAEIIGAKNTELLFQVQANMQENLSSGRTKDGHIVVAEYIPYMKAYIVSRISTPILLKDFYKARLKLIYLFTIIILVLVMSIAIIVKYNIHPLQRLASHMSGSKSLHKPPKDIQGSSETQMLTRAYSDMLNQMDVYLAELEVAYAKRRQYELDLLQMQINPHFLYNTLGSVKHLVGMKDSDTACKTIDSLIGLLRSTIGQSATLVTIQQEIANVENYINIVSPRYGGLITAHINVQEDCLDCKIPNLILQPLVENAFFHAFQATKKGSIRISISLNGEEISCEVMDNGDGMSQEQLESLLSDKPDRQSAVTHIGVSNVKERLEMLYPQKSRLKIISEQGYGTRVQIIFAAQR